MVAGTYRVGVTAQVGSFRLTIEHHGSDVSAIDRALATAARNTTPSGPSVLQPSTATSLPAPPAETLKPTSGVLCNGVIGVPQNGELVFKNLPADRLKFQFDHDAWQPMIHRQPDGMQTLVMRSIKPGTQTKCDMRWEIVQ
jgi:hypothetical protein